MSGAEGDALLVGPAPPQIIREETVKDEKGTRLQPKVPTWKEVLPQVLASSVALSNVTQAGIALAFSGAFLPQLATDPNIKNFTKTEASWIASVVAVTTPVGALVAGPLMDSFGRKFGVGASCVPLLISWIITFLTTHSLSALYFARALAGLGGGMTSVGIVYTAEVTHPAYRSMLLSLNSVFVALGILITTILGVWLEWHHAAMVFSCLAFVSLLLTLILPESPYWLAVFKRVPLDDLKSPIKRLNRPSWMYNDELKRVEEAIVRNSKEGLQSGPLLLSTLRSLKQRACYLPLLMVLGVFTLQQLSGTYVVIFYTLNIFKAVKGAGSGGLDEYTATVILGVLRFAIALLTLVLSHRVGRRPLLILSSLGMALFSGAVALLLVKEGPVEISFEGDSLSSEGVKIWVAWCLILSILLFVAFGAIGHMVIPWAIIGELLPTQLRGVGGGIAISYAYLLMFGVVKSFPFLLEVVPLYGAFFSYALLSILSALFVYFFLPETFRKSFDEISKAFIKAPSPE